MSYLDLFQRYGNPSREAEIRLTAYLLRPDALTADRIKAHDDSAARMIARCNELIDQLTEYRAALAERYAALATSAYRDRLTDGRAENRTRLHAMCGSSMLSTAATVVRKRSSFNRKRTAARSHPSRCFFMPFSPRFTVASQYSQKSH